MVSVWFNLLVGHVSGQQVVFKIARSRRDRDMIKSVTFKQQTTQSRKVNAFSVSGSSLIV